MDDEALNIDILGEVLTSLSSNQGVLGCLITDEEGNSMVSRIPSDINKSICESAIATLYGSSERAINWANQGDLMSVMVEASSGNLLIANASGLNFVVIAQRDVNLGLLRVSMKRASESIRGGVGSKTTRPMQASVQGVEAPKPKIAEARLKIKEVRPKMEEIPLPVLPDIPVSVEIPDDSAGRADLAFEIYKVVFLSLSVGAARVSGVAPTRGMIKRCLSRVRCHDLLEGVAIQRDATLDFKKLKENLERIPPKDRERAIKEKFGEIISSLVDGYGSVMGYAPLKGMTMKEMGLVLKGYKEAMDELGIMNTIPLEIL
ncbi:MAG: hypothetical protein JW778_07160 [Candidatus Altiarchaeota archaeon]|nr:hypothetical protein [Candidatus Altiarchaeota archaeon]